MVSPRIQKSGERTNLYPAGYPGLGAMSPRRSGCTWRVVDALNESELNTRSTVLSAEVFL